jgi:hypothetical protein
MITLVVEDQCLNGKAAFTSPFSKTSSAIKAYTLKYYVSDNDVIFNLNSVQEKTGRCGSVQTQISFAGNSTSVESIGGGIS